MFGATTVTKMLCCRRLHKVHLTITTLGSELQGYLKTKTTYIGPHCSADHMALNLNHCHEITNLV